MKRVIITLSSQDRTLAMKELNNGELQITGEQDRRAVSPTKNDNHSAKEQTIEEEIIAENSFNTWKSAIQNDDKLCDICSGIVNTSNKELEAKKLEVEELKTKLEEELFERLKVEDEFAAEKEHLEREILNMRERIEELEVDASWKIEDLENNFKLLTTKYENAKDEITHLKVMLERTVSENVKLRNNQSITDDRVIEILDELELCKRKAQENAEKGDTSISNLQEEIALNEKEILELKETLKETRKMNEMRLINLNQEISCDGREPDDSQSDPLLDTIKSENLTISNEKQLLELSTELNELYRDHVDYQDKFFALNQCFIAKERELDDVRSDFESQNIEVQNCKEKYAELKDVVLATTQENTHLKNRLNKKIEEYKDLKKNNLVLETEVKWLREALGLIENS